MQVVRKGQCHPLRPLRLLPSGPLHREAARTVLLPFCLRVAQWQQWAGIARTRVPLLLSIKHCFKNETSKGACNPCAPLMLHSSRFWGIASGTRSARMHAIPVHQGCAYNGWPWRLP